MFLNLFNKKKEEARKDAVNKARENFMSWLEISNSPGWKAYIEKIDKKISVIDNKFHDDTSLTPEDLKKLQLAYQIYKEVKRIPKDLEDSAKGGVK